MYNIFLYIALLVIFKVKSSKSTNYIILAIYKIIIIISQFSPLFEGV